jgi:hypothetical protein
MEVSLPPRPLDPPSGRRVVKRNVSATAPRLEHQLLDRRANIDHNSEFAFKLAINKILRTEAYVQIMCRFCQHVYGYVTFNHHHINLTLCSPCILTLICSFFQPTKALFIFVIFCSVHPTYVSAVIRPSSGAPC